MKPFTAPGNSFDCLFGTTKLTKNADPNEYG